MDTDNIVRIELDNQGRLLIKPATKKFTMIYRTASEVHWDQNFESLYSPMPRDWSYQQWFEHIIEVTKDCGCELLITSETEWQNISEDLKSQILASCNKRLL